MVKVLIGCPTYEKYDYCVDEWLDAVKSIIEFSSENEVNAEYLLVDNSKDNKFFEKLEENGINAIKSKHYSNVKDRIVSSRNILREKVLKENYDYFFSLEQDVIPEKDILMKLLSHKKKIVSAYYGKQQELAVQDKETNEIKKVKIELPIVWLKEERGVRRAFPQEVLNRGLIKVEALGIGCMLIAREVFEKIRFRHEPEKKAYDDMFFCLDAKKLGYGCFLDSDIEVKHLHKFWEKENL